MKRNMLQWFGALLLSLTLVPSAFAEGKRYINGIDANYPPFAYVDETGKPLRFRRGFHELDCQEDGIRRRA